MKKMIFIAAALLLCIPAISNAQPKAIGGRIGSSFAFSYQHSLAAGQNGYPNFIQVDFGAAFPFAPSDYFGALATGTYNFVFAKPDWTSRGEWEWFAGPGLSLGYQNGFVMGVTGHVGLHYTFDFGLQLGASFRPSFGFGVNSYGARFWETGVYAGLVPTISVRYAFR